MRDLEKVISTTFSRNECMRLTGITTSRLGYLEKKGIVDPIVLPTTKNRAPKRYTFKHLVEIRALLKLRNSLTLQKLTAAKKYLEEIGKTSTFHDKLFIVSNGEFKLIERKEYASFTITLAGKNQGQLSLLLIDIDQVIDDIKYEGERVTDFNRRVPREYAIA